MIFKPFRGLRPRADLAPKIACPPYDVLDSGEARALAAGDPWTFLHVEKPEIDLDPAIDPYDERVYARGRDALRSMIESGWLSRDPKPSYCVYRLTADGHAQAGIAGVAAVEDYLADRIKKHELTRPEKESDRVRHIEALAAQTGPILAAYRGVPELNAVVRGVVAREPAVDFVAGDGVAHAIWVVDDPAACERIESLFDKIPCAYIADGHHRAAAAARVAKQRREAGADPQPGPWDFFLAVLFPESQLRILGYHRLVRDLNGLDPDSFLERVARAGFVVKGPHRTRRPPRKGTFGLFLEGRWHLLAAKPEIVPAEDAVGGLDVSVLTDHLLQPILGIGDPRTDRRIEFVGGGRGMDELERRVRSREFAVAFSLFPTAMEEVMQVADASRVLPPKSTWFEPKLRSGLLVHAFD